MRKLNATLPDQQSFTVDQKFDFSYTTGLNVKRRPLSIIITTALGLSVIEAKRAALGSFLRYFLHWVSYYVAS